MDMESKPGKGKTRPLKDPFNDDTIKAKFAKLIGHINLINSSKKLKYSKLWEE